ncbi:hypothetical protein J2TS6_52180 [Paenibacillus albilobatus]|uniref:Uncharacterized protein n=1 Tax=Paenibacillus albilobatus TaxID=2716884 RepID=A0A920CEU0_9BACL|nr:hypothetical protein J2TS6_52180 [Paenibacillus albilobatus]
MRELIVHGKSEASPAAVIEQGTGEAERILIGTLGSIPHVCRRMKVKNPALLIIGEVVRVRKQCSG